ncbi:2-hydroxyacid dehydrogenase [Solimonas variicoloris]|uniref:2-hydroxyacid dehydrogenase n=1 Tax=Solimonas variicoloris TaxID=254408 RepID=UPI00037D1B69|nr:2-hydroxyacid dehydrogenase [Solimonas variicoloris]
MRSLEAALDAEFDLAPLWRQADADAFLAAQGAGFVGLVTSVWGPVDAALLARLPNLRVIANFGVGYDALDVAAIRARGIVFSNTPDVLTDCTADLAWAALLDVARGVSAAERFVRRGDWAAGRRFPLQTRVSGKRLGIVGLGRIGRAIARRGEGFGMRIAYHGRRPQADVPYAYHATPQALAADSDFLVIAAAGGAQTRHLVSREVIAALPPQAFLVNVARGSVVDEAALVAALVERRIAGAALDVYAHEPQVPEALLALDNVVLLPHIGSATRETRQAMADLTIANLRAYFRDGRLLTPVTD